MNTDEIAEKFGPAARILFIFRHGYKTPDNHVTVECLQDIVKNGIPGAGRNINVIHLGSEYIRTRETVEALTIWLLNQGVNVFEYPIPSDDRLGNSEVFKLYTSETKEIMKAKNLNNYQILAQLQPDILKDWEKDLRDVVNDIFDMLADGDVCAVPCHSPTVEAIYNVFADKKDPNMFVKELEGIFLVEDEEGVRHVIGL